MDELKINHSQWHLINIMLQEIKEIKKNQKILIFLKENKKLNLFTNLDKNFLNSIALGDNFSFKNLKILTDGLSLKVLDENYIFKNIFIPYESIIGFFSKNLFCKWNENIKISKNPNLKTINNINEFINMQIKNNFQLVVNKGIKEKQIIKIIFFETFLDMENNNQDKLLIFIFDNNNWNLNIGETGLELFDEKKTFFIPYTNIVTYIDTESFIINRCINLSENDFEDLNLFSYEKDNIVYVDFYRLSSSNKNNYFNKENNLINFDGDKKNE